MTTNDMAGDRMHVTYDPTRWASADRWQVWHDGRVVAAAPTLAEANAAAVRMGGVL